MKTTTRDFDAAALISVYAYAAACRRACNAASDADALYSPLDEAAEAYAAAAAAADTEANECTYETFNAYCDASVYTDASKMCLARYYRALRVAHLAECAGAFKGFAAKQRRDATDCTRLTRPAARALFDHPLTGKALKAYPELAHSLQDLNRPFFGLKAAQTEAEALHRLSVTDTARVMATLTALMVLMDAEFLATRGEAA